MPGVDRCLEGPAVLDQERRVRHDEPGRTPGEGGLKRYAHLSGPVRMRTGLDVFGEFAEDGRLGLGPDDLPDDLPAGEHVHGRDGHDAVPLRYRGILVDVELDHGDLDRKSVV